MSFLQSKNLIVLCHELTLLQQHFEIKTGENTQMTKNLPKIAEDIGSRFISICKSKFMEDPGYQIT